MAAGLPVVSFACPSGPPEIIHNRIDGVLVPPDDILALASTLKDLILDVGIRNRLGKAARETVHRYTPDKIVPQWKLLINDVTCVETFF